MNSSIMLIDELKIHRDVLQAEQMERYMRNQFDFLGIQSVKRRKLSMPFLKPLIRKESVDWPFVYDLWKQPYRECQYIACDYLNQIKDRLLPEDIPKFKQLALEKSWWDTIDSLDKVVGTIVSNYPASNQIMIEWSKDTNIWLRRIAINHQRHRKNTTDTVLLEKIIKNNFGTDEFFINKAIGWILRDYSKTNPEWVSQFIKKYENELHALSIKEGSKYISL